MRRRSAPASRTPTSPSIRFTWCAWASARSTRSDATSGTPTTARAGAPERLARMGVALTPDAVHQARTHDPPPPRRHPQRDPPRPLKRPPRGPQQPHPAYQPPQLRLSLRRSPHRPRLPLLQPHHHRPTAMTFTPNSTRAPEDLGRAARAVGELDEAV